MPARFASIDANMTANMDWELTGVPVTLDYTMGRLNIGSEEGETVPGLFQEQLAAGPVLS
jgi:hypothetical protein